MEEINKKNENNENNNSEKDLSQVTKTPVSPPDSNVEEINSDTERERINLEIKMRQLKRQQRYKKKNNHKVVAKIFFLTAVIIIFLGCGFGTYIILKDKSLKSAEYICERIEENILDKDIYIDGEKAFCPTAPIFENDSVYIPLSFIFTNFGHNIIYDEDEKTVSIASDLEVIRLYSSSNAYSVNGSRTENKKPVFIERNNSAYISEEILEKFYPLKIEFSKNNEAIIFDDVSKPGTNAIVEEDAKLYDKNGDALKISAAKGDYVSIYGEASGRVKIITSNGLCGYIDSDLVKNRSEREPITPLVSEPQTLNVKGKPVILFEQISNQTANYNAAQAAIPAEADVLVPTWFSFKVDSENKTSGEIISLADKGYSDYVHNNGRKVWGLITDNFNSNVSRSIVKSTKTRDYIINQIISYAVQYDLDGINIDFENIPADSMREFTQFLRELSASLNNIDVSLSVDVYTPQPWSAYYNRDEFGEVVDYFIVMGYDQHTSSSDESGSVATNKWSEDSITLTMKAGVPAEKLILAIPFYTRIWKEAPGGGFETQSYSMAEGYSAMTSKGASFKWSEEDGQNYAQISSGGYTYKMWLEDEKSVEERLKLIEKYKIAGLAAWRRGLEKNEVWPVIKKYMKG